MVDYKAFKKGYLTEWVDQSQVARRAAEELAKKEVKTTLSDRYKEEGLVFTLDGHKVEFKAENEKKTNGNIYFTYEEAIKLFKEPNKDGWRLPTKEELEDLCNYPYKFKDKQGVFDNRLYLPAEGWYDCTGDVYRAGFNGYYWSSTSSSWYNAWELYFKSDEVSVDQTLQHESISVRLVRDIK